MSSGACRALVAVLFTLVATTGSARQLVGAYLGTHHVYNEISAHAAGAMHFDPEVDTIFEIGGQDSKFVVLQNATEQNTANESDQSLHHGQG